MPLTKPEIARLRSLREKRHREAAGLFVVEGAKVIGELLAAKFALLEIYATADGVDFTVGGAPLPRIEAAEGNTHATVTRISPAEMSRISHYPTPAGVLAVGRIERRPLAPGGLDRGLTLALDGVQDPGNVGALLRVADWFALDRVVLSPDCADLFSQKVINASMGSFARVAVHTAPLADALSNVGAPVLGCDLTGEDLHTLEPLRNAVIVIGGEGRGLSPAVGAHVTRRVTIPRFGRAESLNAAVAAGIVCDHLRCNVHV
jgi:TrmH family RNA methyltransferase